MSDNTTQQEIQSMNEYVLKCLGVKLGENGLYEMIDPNTGLSEEEINAYNDMNASGSNPYEKVPFAEYKKSLLNQKYGDNYFGIGPEQDMNMQNYPDAAKMYEEMKLEKQCTTPGYLNLLSPEERTSLVNDYMIWLSTHQSNLYGFTDEQIKQMSSEQKAYYRDESGKVKECFEKANEADEVVYGVEGIDAKQIDAKESGKSKSVWSSIATCFAVGFNAMKTFYQEKVVPWFKKHLSNSEDKMVESAQESNKKDTAEAEQTQSNENENSAQSENSQQIQEERATQATSIVEEQQTEESDYQK